MKVALVNQPIGRFTLPPDSSIMIGLHEVGRRLARSAEVLVYARRGGSQPAVERADGLEIRRLPEVREVPGLRRLVRLFERRAAQSYAAPWQALDYALAVALDARARRCDVIHVPNYSQFLPILRAFNPAARLVLHMHCEWLTQSPRAVIAPRLRQAHRIVSVSAYLTETIRARFPEYADRCRTVPNGVDVPAFAAGARPPATGCRRVLFVGRVSPEKGVHDLLAAFRLLAAEDPGLHLDIVGARRPLSLDFLLSLSADAAVADLARFYDGRTATDYGAYLQHYLAEAGLEGRVRFWGVLPYPGMVAAYQQADVLVNPSYSESFGMSLIEAMASGVPVIATRIGGMPEIVEGSGAGRLVERGDAPALAEAVRGVLADEAGRQRMGQAGRQHAQAHYSWERVAEDWRRLYQGLA